MPHARPLQCESVPQLFWHFGATTKSSCVLTFLPLHGLPQLTQVQVALHPNSSIISNPRQLLPVTRSGFRGLPSSMVCGSPQCPPRSTIRLESTTKCKRLTSQRVASQYRLTWTVTVSQKAVSQVRARLYNAHILPVTFSHRFWTLTEAGRSILCPDQKKHTPGLPCRTAPMTQSLGTRTHEETICVWCVCRSPLPQYLSEEDSFFTLTATNCQLAGTTSSNRHEFKQFLIRIRPHLHQRFWVRCPPLPGRPPPSIVYLATTELPNTPVPVIFFEKNDGPKFSFRAAPSCFQTVCCLRDLFSVGTTPEPMIDHCPCVNISLFFFTDSPS